MILLSLPFIVVTLPSITQLTVDTQHFDMVAYEIGGEWETLAIFLNLSESDISSLRARQISLYHKAYLCLYRKMIMTGLDNNMLVDVLRQMGKGRLVKQLFIQKPS